MKEQITSPLPEVAAVKDWSLADKIGQMVMVGVPGTEVGGVAEHLIRRYRIGGVILFAENVASPRQVAELTETLQRRAAEAGLPGPLFISIDQEGGPVARIREGVTPLPSMMAIGAAGSLQWAEEVAEVSGRELAALGVNINLAPALDVNNNPANPVIGVRSFGADPRRVARFGVAYVRGLQRAGLLATVKHFPGHGDTDVDSHFALPVVAHDRGRLDAIELVPFRAAIAERVDAVMSAHVTFPAVDPTPGMPSTLSRRVLTDLLRGELGFEGLIITDALEMKGISDQFSIADAAVMAVEAGADIVLIAQSKFNDDAIAAVQALTEAVASGRIPMERIDASVGRIAAAKARMKAGGTAAVSDAEADDFGGASGGPLLLPESVALVEEVTRAAVTVLRDEAKVLPLNPKEAGRLLIVGPGAVAATLKQEMLRLLRSRQSSEGGPQVEAEAPPASVGGPAEGAAVVSVAEVSQQPTAEEREAAVGAAEDADTIVVTTARAHLRAEQAELVKELHRFAAESEGDGRRRKLIVLAVDTPYDLAAFPEVETYVACYGSQPLHLAAAADVLFGVAPARGQLPVSIPGLYSLGGRHPSV